VSDLAVVVEKPQRGREPSAKYIPARNDVDAPAKSQISGSARFAFADASLACKAIPKEYNCSHSEKKRNP